MFNKFLNLTHMNQDTLDAISKWHFWKMLTDSVLEAAYLREYVFPKMFLPRNLLIAEKFVSDKQLFKDACNHDLLINCDLSGFILENKNMLNMYPALFSFASGYQMSDEAAWALMNSSFVEPDVHTLNLNSVWFRSFQTESSKSKEFSDKLETALTSRRNNILDALGNEEVLYSHDTVDILNKAIQSILSFHLELPNENANHNFIKHFNQDFNSDYSSTLSKEVIFWMMSRLPLEKLHSCLNVLPILVYSENIPENLKSYVEEARKLLKYVNDDETNNRKWKQILGDTDYDKLRLGSPELLVNGFFSTFHEIYENTPKKFIERGIVNYKSYPKEVLDIPRTKVFKKYLKYHLEQEHDMTIKAVSLEQLISIYEASN